MKDLRGAVATTASCPNGRSTSAGAAHCLLLITQKIASSQTVSRLHTYFLLTVFLCLGRGVFAQPKAIKSEALQLAHEGDALLAQGEYDQAVQKYSYAHKLVPSDIGYRLGLGQAWFFIKEYDKAMELCSGLMVGRQARAQAFQIYGNCQDGKGMTYEALETYRKGLLKFPQAGILFAEIGLVEAARGESAAALDDWERGILAQPNLPTNYYFAARNCFEMGDYAWAGHYAELFINLERTGDRVRDMSKLLMACYEKARRFDYEKAFQWRFYQVPVLAAGIPPPYPATHGHLDQAYASEFTDTSSTIGIHNLLEVRRFVCHLLPTLAPDDPAIGLWRWQQHVAQLGHWEAYTYWMLYDARPDEFLAWFENHGPQYEAFESWFSGDTFLSHIKRPVARVLRDKKRKR